MRIPLQTQLNTFEALHESGSKITYQNEHTIRVTPVHLQLYRPSAHIGCGWEDFREESLP
jgi:hypothetical protein